MSVEAATKPPIVPAPALSKPTRRVAGLLLIMISTLTVGSVGLGAALLRRYPDRTRLVEDFR
ncbi:hypothetical protein ACWER9_09525 [Micromonospora sp. NPDC003944]